MRICQFGSCSLVALRRSRQFGDHAFGVGRQLRSAGQHRRQFAGAATDILQPSGETEVRLHPVARHRLGGVPHVETGIEPARHALDDHHTFLQQDQFGARLHVENVGIGEELAEQIGHRDFFSRASVDGLADRAHRLRELFDRVMRRHVSGLEMDRGGAVVIARDEAVQDLGEEAAFGKPEPTHDAKIDGDNHAGVVDEQIALMHVGVEKAVAHRVAQEAADHRQSESLEIEPASGERRVIADRRAVDPFERQHALGGAPPVDGRGANAFAGLDIVGHFRNGRGLEPQIHFEIGRMLQVADDGDGFQAADRRIVFFNHSRREEVAVEIAAEKFLNVGPENLHRNRRPHAVAQHVRLVHLRDRRRGDRRSKFDEMIFEPAAERAFDRDARLLHAERRQLVL